MEQITEIFSPSPTYSQSQRCPRANMFTSLVSKLLKGSRWKKRPERVQEGGTVKHTTAGLRYLGRLFTKRDDFLHAHSSFIPMTHNPQIHSEWPKGLGMAPGALLQCLWMQMCTILIFTHPFPPQFLVHFSGLCNIGKCLEMPWQPSSPPVVSKSHIEKSNRIYGSIWSFSLWQDSEGAPMEADPKCPQLTPGTMWNWYWDIIEKNFPTAIEWLLRLGRKNATFFDCQSWFSSLSKTAPRRPILDFDTIFGNVRRSPSLKEHPQPLSRPNERAIRGDGNGFYPRMILRFFGQKLSEIVYNRLQTGRGWQGVIRGLKTVATMCLHAQQFIKFGRAALTQFLRWSGSQEKAWPEINWALNTVSSRLCWDYTEVGRATRTRTF